MSIILALIAGYFIYCCIIAEPKEQQITVRSGVMIKQDLSNAPYFKPDRIHLWELKIAGEPWCYSQCVEDEILFFKGEWKGREKTECVKRNVNHKGHAGLARELVVHAVWIEELPIVYSHGALVQSEYKLYKYCHLEQYEYLYNIQQDMRGEANKNLKLEKEWKDKKKKLGIDHIKPGYIW